MARSPIPAPAPSQSELLERLRDIQSDTRELLSVVRSQSQAARAAAAGATAPGESPSEPGRGWKVATAALASAALVFLLRSGLRSMDNGQGFSQSANARIEVLESRLEELQRQAQRQTANGGVVAQRLIQNELARAARAEKAAERACLSRSPRVIPSDRQGRGTCGQRTRPLEPVSWRRDKRLCPTDARIERKVTSSGSTPIWARCRWDS